MTEAEFLACDDPDAMLRWLMPDGELSGRSDVCLTDRRLRLLACAVCRLAWPLLADPGARAAVEVAERYADGLATEREMADAGDEADAPGPAQISLVRLWWAARATTLGGARDAASVAVDYSAVPRPAQAALLRCVLGNPFRPASLCGLPYCAGSAAPGASCGECRRLREAPDVRGLARAAYELPRPCPRCGGEGKCVTENSFRDFSHRRPVLRLEDCPHCHGGRSDGFLNPPELGVLADALTDAGCTNESLLGHLHELGPHAKGCWAVDLVLGKV